MTGAFVVLAGGKSRRMGRAKAFLPVGDRELLCRVLDACAAALPEGVLVANAPSRYAVALARYGWRRTRRDPRGEGVRFRRAGARLRVVADLREGRGPVAGVEAGLSGLSDEAGGPVFLAACDLPFLEPSVVTELLGRLGTPTASASHPAAVVPVAEGRLQPLAAAYTSAVGRIASRCLDAGRRRMEDLLEGLEVRAVPAESLGPPEAFLNVNTPHDLDRVRRIAAARRSPPG